jgi:hypothetical protein
VARSISAVNSGGGSGILTIDQIREPVRGEKPMKPIKWDIRREARRWTNEEFNERTFQAPDKIEYADGIFGSERQRLIVLGMLLENLGIDRAIRFGNLEDWKAAIADLEKKQGSGGQP